MQEIDHKNFNQHKYFALVPTIAFPKEFDFNLGELVDIEIKGKAIGRGFRLCGDMGFQLSNDKKNILIIDLIKAKPYIKIHYRN
jgi:hypothetical protein